MADPRRFRRRSIRLRGYDYGAPGSYVITVCTHRRAATLGQLSGAGVALSAEGRALELAWRALPAHFPHVRLAAFMIMPDHFHGISVIERRVGQPARRAATRHRAGLAAGDRAEPQVRLRQKDQRAPRRAGRAGVAR